MIEYTIREGHSMGHKALCGFITVSVVSTINNDKGNDKQQREDEMRGERYEREDKHNKSNLEEVGRMRSDLLKRVRTTQTTYSKNRNTRSSVYNTVVLLLIDDITPTH
jgi:hypothetical protein